MLDSLLAGGALSATTFIGNVMAGIMLKAAATAAGLSDCFVHIRNLGDYSVSYFQSSETPDSLALRRGSSSRSIMARLVFMDEEISASINL
jgi:hypothetical protein